MEPQFTFSLFSVLQRYSEIVIIYIELAALLV